MREPAINVDMVNKDVAGLKFRVRNSGNINGPPRGFGDLGRMAIYFQGFREHW